MKKKESQDMLAELELILEYGMTPQEAKAWRVCCYWCKLSREILPEMKHNNLPKKGDPRKSSLFRYAWKMIRDTESYGLADTDIPLYIRAQLEMIKSIQIDDKGTHARVDPGILTGDKAWIRWKMYKKKISKSNESQQHKSIEINTPKHKIIQELDSTIKFFFNEYKTFPSKEEIKNLKENLQLKNWASQRRISFYYCLLSPFVKDALAGTKMQDYFGMNLDMYKNDINKEILAEMMKRFPHEFKK